MTIAAVGFSRQAGTHNVATVALTRTVTIGDPIGIIAVGNSGVATPTITDNGSAGGNTYTACSVASVTDTNRTMKAWLFSCLPTKSATIITADWGAANPEYAWLGAGSASGASGYDNNQGQFQAGAIGGSTDNILTPTRTPAAQPGLAFGFHMGPGAMTPGTGFAFDTFGSDFPHSGVGYSASWITQSLRFTSLTALASLASQGSSSDALSVVFLFTETATGGGKLVGGVLVGGSLAGVLA